MKPPQLRKQMKLPDSEVKTPLFAVLMQLNDSLTAGLFSERFIERLSVSYLYLYWISVVMKLWHRDTIYLCVERLFFR